VQACVALLCEVGAFDDAVALALRFDRSLAADVARRPADEGARRQAWLAIATHLFAQPASAEVCPALTVLLFLPSSRLSELVTAACGGLLPVSLTHRQKLTRRHRQAIGSLPQPHVQPDTYNMPL